MGKMALERLALHNELCCQLWGPENADQWLREGFQVSKRIDSVKRHLDEAHKLEREEDAIGHAIWNFMAVYHVVMVFPGCNDLPNYEMISQASPNGRRYV